jgi:hypothetical protein
VKLHIFSFYTALAYSSVTATSIGGVLGCRVCFVENKIHYNLFKKGMYCGPLGSLWNILESQQDNFGLYMSGATII